MIRSVARALFLAPIFAGLAFQTSLPTRGSDATPPELMVSQPLSGATEVALDSMIVFVFSEPMLPMQSIEWSGDVNAANFSYSWMPGNMGLVCSYSGGFPGNTTVAWTLNPIAGGATNFRDAAGNELPAELYQGFFTTVEGGDPTDPCDDPTEPDDGIGFAGIYKNLQYVQTGNSTPVLDLEDPAYIGASYRGPTNQTTATVDLTGPNGLTESLFSFFGSFMFSDFAASPAGLDEAYPAGEYTFTSSGSLGTQSVTLTLSDSGSVNVPQIENLVELAALNPAADFTLNFSALSGAGPNDSISIHISDDADTVFMAPDFCRGIELANTATSVVIPAGTFASGQTYHGSITFNRVSEMDSTSIPDLFAMAAVSAVTSFEFTVSSGGPQPTPPMFLNPVRNPDGTIDFPVASDSGATIIIEGTADFQSWTVIRTEVAVGGNLTTTITPGATGHQYFRAKIL